MDVDKMLEEHRERMDARTVFGEPYRQNGVTVIPAAKFAGGAGGGGEESGDGGGGYGLGAKPAGALVIREDGSVEWKVPFDRNKVILGAQVIVISLIATVGLVLRTRAKAAQRVAIAGAAIGKTAELVARRHAD